MLQLKYLYLCFSFQKPWWWYQWY